MVSQHVLLQICHKYCLIHFICFAFRYTYNISACFVQFVVPLLIAFPVYLSIYCKIRNRPQSQHSYNNYRFIFHHHYLHTIHSVNSKLYTLLLFFCLTIYFPTQGFNWSCTLRDLLRETNCFLQFYTKLSVLLLLLT